MLKKTLITLILLLSYNSYAQIYVEWDTFRTNEPTLHGRFLGGTVDVIQEGAGADLTFTSTYPTPLLMGADLHHFVTYADPEAIPSKKITFNFSRPVVISRLNIGDINVDSRHNDSFSIQGVTFTSVVSTGGAVATVNSATAVQNVNGNIMWHLSTTSITSFSIEYAVTDYKTHSFITYALEVLLPGGVPGGPGGQINEVKICPNATTELIADTPLGSNYSYEWSVPPTVPNPGNQRSMTTSTIGVYGVLATNLTTGVQNQIQSWHVKYHRLRPTTFVLLPTSICPDKQTLNTPFPTTSLENIPGQWRQNSINPTSVEYVFIPDPGLCGDTVFHTVPIRGITPVFAQPDPVCNFNDIALSTTSMNSIIGNWTLVSNNSQSATYNFTPDLNQCAFETQVTVQILPKSTPYFDIAMPACNNDGFTFPTISLNHITGKWTLLSENAEKFIYEFEPDDLNCNEKITIEILKLKIPEFSAHQPICEQSEISLPTTSLNGYEGTWEQVKQTATSIEFLFTPIDFCVDTVPLTINIIPKTKPEFDQLDVNCKFDEDQLPRTSKNGITGSWKLTDEKENILTYNFTPTSGQCAVNYTMKIVNALVLTLNFEPQCINDKLFLKTHLSDGDKVVKITSYKYYYNGRLVSEQDKLNITDLNISEQQLPATFEVTATAENGCEFSNSIKISHTDCAIPKGISPGSDNINDVLDLKNFKVKKLSIFNRYGRIVYEKYNYKNEWGGQNNSGNLLPTGTYFYQIDFANETASQTGWIYLNIPK